MLVENTTVKPASEAPPLRAPVEQAPARRSAIERNGLESLRDEADVEPRQAPSPRSRLTYDDELSRVFVEVVDPDSGEVVSRFPPEQLVRHIDSLIDQELVPKSQTAKGFLLDQSV